MSMTLQEAEKVLNQLRGAFDAGDVDAGKSILATIKILMLDFPIGDDITEAHLTIATSALEMGVLISVVDQDLDAFARNLSQLKPYYTPSPVSTAAADPTTTPETPTPAPQSQKCHILGLNLMYLLVENNLSEFHAELELLTPIEASTPYLTFPITLERQLMVGSYDEVLSAGLRVPDPSYSFFVENLLQTVRDSIADCLEVGYRTMAVKDAVGMMRFGGREELMAYVEEYRDDWIVEADEICFQVVETGSRPSDIPSMKLIAQSLSYATELERIV